MAEAVMDARERAHWVAALERGILGKPDDAVINLALIPLGAAGGEALNALQFLQRLWPHMAAENTPRTVSDVRNLINWQHHPLPASPPMGNYYGAFLGPGAVPPLKLNPDARQRLIDANKRLIGGSVMDGMTPQTRNMDDQIASHLQSHPRLNRNRQRLLLTALDRPASAFSKYQQQQLLLTAQMLHIDPELGLRRNHIAGFDLYSAKHSGLTLEQVRKDLNAYLVQHKGVKPDAVDAVAHIMLACVAPEFLVQKIPATLHIGSPAWLLFRSTVALLEENAPGSSRLLTYSQILDRASLRPMTPEQVTLFHAAEADPLLDWALMHGVIAPRADDDYSVEDLRVAASTYNTYIETTHQAATVLSKPVKTRRELARADLEAVLAPELLDKPMHRARYTPAWPLPSFGFEQSLVDLHMMGRLKNRTFRSDEVSLPLIKLQVAYRTDPQIEGLQGRFRYLKHDVKSLDQAIRRNTEDYSAALSSSFIDILSKMPYADRQLLDSQELTFYRVETESINGAGVHRKSADEQIEAVQGRYGFLVRAGNGADAKCYEFFPQSGTYVERPQLLRALDAGEAVVPRLWVARLKSHVDNATAGASEVQIRALRETVPAQASPSASGLPPLGFFSPRARQIADYVSRQNLVLDPANLLAAAQGKTPEEAFNDRVSLAGKTIVNMLVPFKACYDDIVSGRVKHDLGAMTGCATDVAAAVAVVGGSVAQGVQGVARAETGLSRLGAGVRAVGSLTNGLLNPAAGLSDPLIKAYQWLGNGALLRLSKPVGKLRAAWRAQLDHQRFGRPRQMRRDSLKSGLAEVTPNSVEAVQKTTRAEVKRIVERSQPVMVAKLDDALSVIADPAQAEAVDFVFKSFQGTSSAHGRKLLTSRIKGLKAKAQALSANNIKFMRSKNHDWVAQFSPEDFNVDKTGKYIEINIDGSKHYYQHFGSQEGAMSNALIHELDHVPGAVTKGSLDFAYLTRLNKDTENAAGLLNLAKGHTEPRDLVSAGADAPDLVGKTGVSMYGSRAGSLNAESTMTSVALLAQLKTDPELFKQNRALIEDALKAFGDSPITDQVGIKIVTKRSASKPAPSLIYAMDEGTGKLIGVYRLMRHAPGSISPGQPPSTQTARSQGFQAYVQEHLVL